MTNTQQPKDDAQPSRECLQQSAVEEAVTLLRKYKKLCEAVGRGDGFHLKRIEDTAAALQAAPPAPAAVAAPSNRIAEALRAFDTAMEACSDYPDTSGDIDGLVKAVRKARAALAAAPAQAVAVTEVMVKSLLDAQDEYWREADAEPRAKPCNWRNGMDYEAARIGLEAALFAPTQAVAVPWDNFPAYLIDHCEGDTITEEGLQRALAAMLADPQYAAPAQEHATQLAGQGAMEVKTRPIIVQGVNVGEFESWTPAAPAAPAQAQEDAQIAKLTTAYTELSNMFHDQIVAQQAAWIEWQHGQGAEAAMGWIENGLCGPGHIPDEDDPYGKQAQAWFDANKSDPFPACACGRPSNILWMDQGFCSKAHYDAARAAQGGDKP